MPNTVAIVGAGPVGLTLACELAAAGVDAVVLEKLTEPRTTSPGAGINPAVVELFTQRGIMDLLAQDGFTWNGAHFAQLPLDPTQLPEKRAFNFIVSHMKVEQRLEEFAVAHGARIERGHEVVGLEQNAGGVVVRTRTADGEREFAADYVVACDGMRSTVRAMAGIEFAGVDEPFYGLIGDFAAGPDSTLANNIGVHAHPGLIYSIHPTGPGRVRITAGQFLNSPADPDAPPTLEELQAWLGPITGKDLAAGAEPVWFDRWFYVTRQAVQYRSGRVFVAGDAAHVHFPLGGQAVSTGVEDAVNLGWKLAATLHGWAPEGLLDTYHAERHPIGARALLTTHAQAALLHPIGGVDGARAILSDLIKIPEVNAYFVRLAGGTDVHYGAPEGAHPLTGSRTVNATLVTDEGETEVATALRAARGVLLDLSAEPGAYAGTVAGWSDRVDTVAAKPTTEIDASAVLLRPDGRVAWAAGAGADPSGLDAALHAWFGAPTAA